MTPYQAFRVWLDQWLANGGSVASIHQDDLQDAFIAGWHRVQPATETEPTAQ